MEFFCSKKAGLCPSFQFERMWLIDFDFLCALADSRLISNPAPKERTNPADAISRSGAILSKYTLLLPSWGRGTGSIVMLSLSAISLMLSK